MFVWLKAIITIVSAVHVKEEDGRVPVFPFNHGIIIPVGAAPRGRPNLRIENDHKTQVELEIVNLTMS